jgi:DNA-binding CsgD family transcriptional regulator
MPFRNLSDRQGEVMQRYCGGESAAEIGRVLRLSPAMLRAYYRHIRRRYGGQSIEGICQTLEASDLMSAGATVDAR